MAARERLGLRLQLFTLAPSQYGGFNFNSFCEFAGRQFGANEDGIFELTGNTDNGTAIYALLELIRNDLGDFHEKRLRKVYLAGELGGNLTVSLQFDEDVWKSFTVTASETGLKSHGEEFYCRRDQKGRYFMIRIENVDGSDFSLDSIAVLPVFTQRTAGK